FREGRYGRFVGCSDFPTCRHTEQILITMGVPCPTCGKGEITQRRTRKGRFFYGCSRYPDCDYTSWEKPKDGVPTEVIAETA
ncbi:MAG: topoisomerase DNA-binding C4 zinc finger domain-containing protein, partial [Anaerolineales bacterium]|nr:topoisomerase DNA-binding C4 zinc finger domain-containing protein [Anaerolineales bacterium]